MAKVYEFPVKVQLTEEMVVKLHKVAKEYAEVLNDIMNALCSD